LNNRQRALSVLNHQKPDYVPWFADLTYWYSSLLIAGKLPEQYLGDGEYQLQKDLGVGWYIGYWPFQAAYDGVTFEVREHDHYRYTTLRTPRGELHEVMKYLPESFCWAYEEHYVKNYDDLMILWDVLERTTYLPDYDLASRKYDIVGDNGIVLCYLPRSPFMELVTTYAGITTLTYLILDAPDAFDEFYAFMRQKHDEAAEIALNCPAECLLITENLSSEVVGKRFYHRYLRDYESTWVKRIHAAGKFSFIHMDGTLRGLIREVAEVGFNVIEACTPAPVGDIEPEDLRNWVLEDTIIWGGIPGLYFSDLISDRDFDEYVIRLLRYYRSHPNFVLGVSDQVPPGTHWERIRRVSELVDLHGKIEY